MQIQFHEILVDVNSDDRTIDRPACYYLAKIAAFVQNRARLIDELAAHDKFICGELTEPAKQRMSQAAPEHKLGKPE
jgi:hypothetical protein